MNCSEIPDWIYVLQSITFAILYIPHLFTEKAASLTSAAALDRYYDINYVKCDKYSLSFLLEFLILMYVGLLQQLLIIDICIEKKTFHQKDHKVIRSSWKY